VNRVLVCVDNTAVVDDPYTNLTSSDGVTLRREDITTARHQQQRNQEAASRSQSRTTSPTPSVGEKGKDPTGDGSKDVDAASKPAVPLAFAVETVTVSPANIDRLLCAIDATMQVGVTVRLVVVVAPHARFDVFAWLSRLHRCSSSRG
jgi:hypothetical protein